MAEQKCMHCQSLEVDETEVWDLFEGMFRDVVNPTKWFGMISSPIGRSIRGLHKDKKTGKDYNEGILLKCGTCTKYTLHCTNCGHNIKLDKNTLSESIFDITICPNCSKKLRTDVA